MAKVIFTVLFLIVAVLYGAMFVMWNMEVVSVVGFVSPMDPDQGYATEMPLAFLAVIGAIVGVLVMAIASWATWAAQRDAARQAQRQLAVAKQKLQERTEMVRKMRADLQAAKGRNTMPATAEEAADPEAIE